MATVRNAPVAFRFDPDVKQALSLIAERDGRSMANMMEWLIRKHCEREQLGWPPHVEKRVAGRQTERDTSAKSRTSAKTVVPVASERKKS
jgi:hypothetical protein